jgi:hypothetical protein
MYTHVDLILNKLMNAYCVIFCTVSYGVLSVGSLFTSIRGTSASVGPRSHAFTSRTFFQVFILPTELDDPTC